RPKRRPPSALKSRKWRPTLEVLEDRLTPAAVTWINPAGGDWDTASNWSSGAVPGAGDDVVINVLNASRTVTHATSASVSVARPSSQAPLVLSAGSLSLATHSVINNDLTISIATLIDSGDLTVTGLLTSYFGTLQGTGTVNAEGGAELTDAVVDG